MWADVDREWILSEPCVQWDHIDGPLLTWAGNCHWLTWGERLALFFRLEAAEQIAARKWEWLWSERRLLLEAARATPTPADRA